MRVFDSPVVCEGHAGQLVHLLGDFVGPRGVEPCPHELASNEARVLATKISEIAFDDSTV